MRTPSTSPACSLTDNQEYDRVVAIAAEFCRAHPHVTIAAGLRPGRDHLILIGVIRETKRRAKLDVPRGVSRDELMNHFRDATGIDDSNPDWDW